jgi:AcrR family transcriptional regulator
VEPAPATLRERSKARRRRAIQIAALRLFTEHGYEGTTLSDIAVAAEVAPRTVSLYFPSKAELALSQSNAVAARLSATCLAYPGAHFLEVIDRWLTQEAELGDPELVVLTNAMFAANPQLRALSSASITESMQLASVALFADIGLSLDDPMAAVVVASIAAAIMEYNAVSASRGPSPTLRNALLNYLRAMIDAARGPAT